jgi:hypothetical protein
MMRFRNWLSLGTVAALALGWPALLAAQAPANPNLPAEKVYKNIKVLTGTPASEVTIGMHLIEAALGTECEHCHFEPDFARDGKQTKETARAMMKMVMDINKNNFGGKPVVQCYTCHHGSVTPTSTFVIQDTLAPMVPYGTEKQEPKLPSVDAILNKYIQALGGEDAIRKVTSRSITATRNLLTGPGGVVPLPAVSEEYRKAPNRSVIVSRGSTITVAEGFDGTTMWAQNAAGAAADALPIDTARAKRDLDLQASLNLKKTYARMEVTGISRVGTRDAYLVVGYPQDDLPEKLYFDISSGLLVRKITALSSVMGEVPFETDYDDYRATNSGVKIPFWIRSIPGAPRSAYASTMNIRIQKVEDNASIDDAKFTKPASKPQPPRPQ